MNDYRYLPADCRNGRCNHETGHCIHYRSRYCLSGECSHFSNGLVCGTNQPTPDSPRRGR